MTTRFYRFSTAGNTTLFVEKPCDLKEAIQAMPAEQAGIADLCGASLVMGGGELCINACLAFGALMDLRGFKRSHVKTANQELAISTTGACPHWQASLFIVPSSATLIEKGHMAFAHWPGITHLLIQCNQLPDANEAMQKAPALMREHCLTDKPAAGVVWWKQENGHFAILPVVHVPALQTTFIEGACGSASISLALLPGPDNRHIRQVSGCCITVSQQGSMMRVDAPVRLLAEGSMWI